MRWTPDVQRVIGTLVAGFALAVLSACGHDPKAPTEANFTVAIDDYLAEGGHGDLCFTSATLPHTLSQFDMAGVQSQLLEMREAGLVRSEQKTVRIPRFFAPPLMQQQTTYDLTRAGATHLTSNVDFGGARFCFAKIKVGKIDKFTEPNSLMGVTVTQVTWEPAIASMESWMQALLSAKKLGSVQRLVDQTVSTQHQQLLDLTNKGWEAQ